VRNNLLALASLTKSISNSLPFTLATFVLLAKLEIWCSNSLPNHLLSFSNLANILCTRAYLRVLFDLPSGSQKAWVRPRGSFFYWTRPVCRDVSSFTHDATGRVPVLVPSWRLAVRALFSFFLKFFRDTVAVSFVCGNYCPIID